MRITPMDIRQQQFTVRMFRGFDVQEVDTFLEDVAQDYEALIKENALLKEQLQVLEDRTRGLEEKVLQQTLVSSQQFAEDIKESARREAALLLREAELEGEKLLESNRTEEAMLRNEILQLKRQRRQVAEGLRATLDMYQRMLDQDIRDEPASGSEG